MRELMQARLLAFAHVVPVVGADLDPPLNRVSVAAPPPAHHRQGVRVRRERRREPRHLLDGTNISSAMPMANYPAVHDKHRRSQRADRQSRGQLRAIRIFLQPGHINSSPSERTASRPKPSPPKYAAVSALSAASAPAKPRISDQS